MQGLRFSFNKRSIVLTWFLSYAVILLLPVIIGILVYFESSRTLKEEIDSANESLLKQVREVMDNQFQTMERLNLEMTWNLKVQEVLFSNKYEVFPKDYEYDLYQISQELKAYKTSYSFIDLFYLYLNEDDKVILPGTVRGGPFAYATLHKTERFPFSAWSSLLKRTNNRGFVPMYRITDDGKLEKTVAYVSSYPMEKDGPSASNVIMIDQARILGAIRNVELFNKGHVFILNQENQVLVSNSDSAGESWPIDSLADSSKLLYKSPEGEEFEVMKIGSARSGLQYVSMVPRSLYWSKAEHVRRLTFMSMAVSLLGGGLLMTVFLRMNYHPVRRLVQAFSRQSASQSTQPYNEFRFLQEAVDRTLLEVDQIRMRMEQQRHVLRSNFITRLLRGRPGSEIPVAEALTTFGMKFESDDFGVLLLVVEESGAFFERFPDSDEGNRWKLLHFIVMNVMEELANQNNAGYAAEVDEMLACLVNFTMEDRSKQQEELLRIAREAQAFLAAQYHIHLTVSIGGIHSGLAGIARAFTEAVDAMEYKLVMGRKEILSYGEIRPNRTRETENGYYYPLQVEQQLMGHVKLGETEKAEALLHDIIERNVKRPGVSVLLARLLMMDLVSTMLKTIGETGEQGESFLQRGPKPLEPLLTGGTVGEMHEGLTLLLREVCEFTGERRRQALQQSRQKGLGELVEEVKAFIEGHYRDPNLNVTMIGQQFDRKPTYLSKLFKDGTGEGLLDYINKVRVEQAKVLMKTKSVGEAASCVGFNDTNAFIRAFKKTEGLTPGKYKEALGSYHHTKE